MTEYTATRQQELANAITHGLGLLFCIIAMPILLNNALKSNSTGLFLAALVFGFGMLMVYASSTLYHAIRHEKIKDWFLILDHISIYFLIAGTYTPLVVKYLPHSDAVVFLSVMWGMVAIGTVFKLFFTGKFGYLSLILYILMGWMIVFIAKPVMQNVPASLLWWIAIGGISYMVGVLFYLKSHVKYCHAIWHCFVLGGTVSHYIFIYQSLQILG
ncbi:MAG: hemolysin III family protein [Saprospiraceae bacterium]|nr:hemolysin III family protein [Saprospiraceae bacterium]